MKILITGGTGMVGSAFRNLNTSHNLVLVGSSEYDLTKLYYAHKMFVDHNPDAVIHLAAKVGGVKGNSDYIADFFHENILINTNLLNAAKEEGIQKVVSLLSTCIYPDKVKYPLTEDQIHNGEPHQSNYGYAYAKRMLEVHSRALRSQYGLKYITAVPNNIYGFNDNFHLENGHVIPALIRKIWEGKQNNSIVNLWGDGSSLREFTYSLDIAETLIWLLENYDGSLPINIGNCVEYSIKHVASIICEIFEFPPGMIFWDTTKPIGQHRKPSSTQALKKLGYNKSYTNLRSGLEKTCEWFIESYPHIRGIL